jgi:hypothetical protein
VTIHARCGVHVDFPPSAASQPAVAEQHGDHTGPGSLRSLRCRDRDGCVAQGQREAALHPRIGTRPGGRRGACIAAAIASVPDMSTVGRATRIDPAHARDRRRDRRCSRCEHGSTCPAVAARSRICHRLPRCQRADPADRGQTTSGPELTVHLPSEVLGSLSPKAAPSGAALAVSSVELIYRY